TLVVDAVDEALIDANHKVRRVFGGGGSSGAACSDSRAELSAATCADPPSPVSAEAAGQACGDVGCAVGEPGDPFDDVRGLVGETCRDPAGIGQLPGGVAGVGGVVRGDPIGHRPAAAIDARPL